jgi:phosphoglycerate dehydrogenase-like enzyme
MSTKVIGVNYKFMTPSHREAIQNKADQLGYTVRFAEGDVPDEWYQGCEIVFGIPNPQALSPLKELRWLQTAIAGAERYLAPGVLPEGILYTNASGAFGIGISEHMLAQLLVLFKRSEAYLLAQRRAHWGSQGRVRMVYGSTATVLGLGDIGCEFARRMHAMGAFVRGVKRTMAQPPPYVDELYAQTQLDRALDGADIVALCLPGTAETAGLLDAQRIGRLKPGAVIMNVGRGTAIDQDAMIAALRSGHLGGACLDVVTPEPLPEDNPLWTLPNVVFTPHVAGGSSCMITVDKAVELFLCNLEDYAAGRPFKRTVDRRLGY